MGLGIIVSATSLGVMGWSSVRHLRAKRCLRLWFDPYTGTLRTDVRKNADGVITVLAAIPKVPAWTPETLARAAFVELSKSRPCVGTLAEHDVTSNVWPILLSIAKERLAAATGF